MTTQFSAICMPDLNNLLTLSEKKKQDFTSVPLPLLKVMIVQITWYLLLMRTATLMSQNHL